MAFDINDEVAHFENLFLTCIGVLSGEDIADAEDEFAGAERLRHVIFCPKLETQDAIYFSSLGCLPGKPCAKSQFPARNGIAMARRELPHTMPERCGAPFCFGVLQAEMRP